MPAAFKVRKKNTYVNAAKLHLTIEALTLEFPSSSNNTELSPINFFSVVGNSIRSVTIGNSPYLGFLFMVDFQPPEYGRSIGLEHTFELIRLCPSLQELKLRGTRADAPSPSYNVVKHMGVKKLSVYGVNDPLKSIRFLPYMSLNLPNIQEVDLSFMELAEISSNTIVTVDMPYTSLQLLRWIGMPKVYYPNETGLKVCIKLETAIGKRFYTGEKAGLLEINEEKYNNSKLFRFKIKCQSLKELVITEARKSPLLKLIF